MDTEEIVAALRARVEQCRRLAQSATDERTRITLLNMALEGEAEIKSINAQVSQAAKCQLPPTT